MVGDKVSESLARLMAMENLRVEHRKTTTAMFDLQNRILILPVFKTDMSKDVYELLTGHEIGHALETPTEGWHNAVMVDSQALKNKGKGFKSFLNVVEDARIERKIKSRYPGLRRSFSRGYKELFDKNFFGDLSKNPEKLLLVDRINLYYKVGALTMVEFTEEELKFLERIDVASSWEDVVKIATDLYNYCSDELQEMLQDQPDEFLMGGSDDSDDEDFDSELESSPGEEYDSVESLTDKAFREREEEFVNADCAEIHYITLPEVDVFEHIISYKTILETNLVTVSDNSYYKENSEDLKTRLFKTFVEKNTKYVNYLAKEFELKKNAAQQVRARQNKTGMLDVAKLYRYKFDDEIFKAVTTVPGGKSHGLVMFIDWSGSMQSNLAATIEQLLVLVLFCKRVNIPFEVFSFLSYRPLDTIKNIEEPELTKMASGDLITMHNFTVAQLLSSDMKRAEFNSMVKQLLVVREMYNGKGGAAGRCSLKISLGNTPLNETILFARHFLEMYKKQKKLDIVNTVVLSDGEGSPLNHKDRNQFSTTNALSRFVYIDPTTKKQVMSDTVGRYCGSDTLSLVQLKAFVQLTKECTGSNMLGFYLLESAKHCKKFFSKGDDAETCENEVRKNKFAVAKVLGFDEYYFIRGGRSLEIEDEKLEIESGATKTRLLSAFKKNQGKKIMNRVVLNRFIAQIS